MLKGKIKSVTTIKQKKTVLREKKKRINQTNFKLY